METFHFKRIFLASIGLLAAAISGSAQSTPSFRYVIPRFSSTSGSELVVSNLTSRLATPEITLVNSATQQVSDIFMNIQAGTQTRFTAQSLGFSAFAGPVLITSGVPLSVMATVMEVN